MAGDPRGPWALNPTFAVRIGQAWSLLVQPGSVRRGALPYTRVIRPATAGAHSSGMTRALVNAVAYATVVAMLLALVAVSPAAAGSVTRVPDAEKYAHSLLNCTRTGGFVTRAGTCVGRGSGKYSAKRLPVRLHKNISQKVAWPWARTMNVYDKCDHVIAGKPQLAQRMRSKGFRYWYYGENVGCMSGTGDAKAVVLLVHRLMQAEKQARGGHWQNIKNSRFKSVGIGVAMGNGRVMVVWDFYGKRY